MYKNSRAELGQMTTEALASLLVLAGLLLVLGRALLLVLAGPRLGTGAVEEGIEIEDR